MYADVYMAELDATITAGTSAGGASQIGDVLAVEGRLRRAHEELHHHPGQHIEAEVPHTQLQKPTKRVARDVFMVDLTGM